VIEVEARGAARTRRAYAGGGSDAEYLPRFGWARGSRSVWFVVLNRVQTALQLRRLDVASGRVTTLFGTSDPAWLNLTDDPVPMAEDPYLWSTEATGYRHLVVVGPGHGGVSEQAITRGDWEVTSLVTKEDLGRWVYFTATQAGPLERQLYRVRADGSQMERLTAEPGTHSVEAAPGRTKPRSERRGGPTGLRRAGLLTPQDGAGSLETMITRQAAGSLTNSRPSAMPIGDGSVLVAKAWR
jgi:hypothetical protein